MALIARSPFRVHVIKQRSMRQLIDLFICLSLNPLERDLVIQIYLKFAWRLILIPVLCLLIFKIINSIDLKLRNNRFTCSIVSLIKFISILLHLKPIIDLIDLIKDIKLKWVPLIRAQILILLLPQIHPLLSVKFLIIKVRDILKH